MSGDKGVGITRREALTGRSRGRTGSCRRHRGSGSTADLYGVHNLGRLRLIVS